MSLEGREGGWEEEEVEEVEGGEGGWGGREGRREGGMDDCYTYSNIIQWHHST